MEFPEIQKVHQLLATKDDTSRFVGLLLLKTTLDNHASDLQHEQVAALWNSISPRFLDRLIRTGSRQVSGQRKQAGDMLDVAVAVIYTFTKLLNDCAVNERFYARIPNLATAVLSSSEETTRRILELIHVLVQQPDGQTAGGATCFAKLDIDSWEPLIEIAPQHETVFSIFHWAWIKGSIAVPVENMTAKIDNALQSFISSFKGHNPTSLLNFITLIFENLNPNLRPLNPQWLRPVARLIQDMASSKQTADGRRAYTHCAAALLAAYPEEAPKPLFSDDPNAAKPIAYLFVKMVQVDILSTLHVLIPKLDTAEYPSLSRRIAGALDIMTSFVGFLITAADDEAVQKGLTPDRILKLHEDLVRMIGDVMEYLRDRWDAFLAGARGIESTEASGRNIFEDPITPAAIRLIATWLRDDDGEALRTQAAGLVDLFGELYKMNLSSTDMPELRLPILAALEGILHTSDGREAFNDGDLLSRCVYPDLRAILASQDVELTAGDYLRGSAIVQVFHILMEYDENLRSHPGSIDFLESVAKYEVKPVNPEAGIPERSRLEFQTDLLELAVMLLDTSARGVSPALQQKIKTGVKGSISKVAENWGIIDDESMVARMAELRLD
ncbi:Neurochondrin-domain-containing protein [Xylaria cf. heliscus]|nr:Neurochondrin-domain-containing protein [Xylaria cf. heliscus]